MLTKFDYFDHDADIGIIGRGSDIETAFINAACAVFNIMTDLSLVIPQQDITISFEEADNELALVTWLNLLLGKARENSLIFCQFDLHREGESWMGHGRGERWRNDIPRGTEVKGATLTMLTVHKNDHWEARCIVDV